MLTAQEQEQLEHLKARAAQNGNGGAPPPVAPGWNPQQQAPAPVAAQSWAQPQPQAGGIPPIVGVGVPIKLTSPGGGTLRVDLMLPAEVAANPGMLQAAIAALAQAGFPLDVWQPKQNGWGGGNRGGGGGGWGQRSGW